MADKEDSDNERYVAVEKSQNWGEDRQVPKQRENSKEEENEKTGLTIFFRQRVWRAEFVNGPIGGASWGGSWHLQNSDQNSDQNEQDTTKESCFW